MVADIPAASADPLTKLVPFSPDPFSSPQKSPDPFSERWGLFSKIARTERFVERLLNHRRWGDRSDEEGLVFLVGETGPPG
jgi:hypothetical protein